MENQNRGRKRKNKKSLLQKAKKYGKKGKFGRGSHLNEDSYQYFVRVLELLNENSFESEEEKVIFINNVFDETLNEEVNYSCNQLASAVLEKLLPKANESVLKRFISAFDQDIRPICSDPYASHVLQKILLITSGQMKVSEVKSEDETPSDFEKWIIKVGRFVLNNLEELVWNTYANHVVRTVVECLGGIASIEARTNCKTQVRLSGQVNLKASTPPYEVPSTFKELLKEYVCRLSAWPQFPDLARSNLTSGLLQSLLYATNAVDKKVTNKLISKLLDECFTSEDKEAVEEKNKDAKKKTDNPEILALFDNVSVTHVLESALAIASSKSLTQIYARCFINRLGILSKHPHANFSVQRLLDYCAQKEEFEQLYSELEMHFEGILASRNTGVLVSLGEGCKRHATKQGNFQQALMKALHCMEPTERQSQLAPLTLSLKTHEDHSESSISYIHLHGSLILQTLLNFNKPIKVVNSLLEMNSNDLKKVFTDPKGCHVMDAFMKSAYVGEKSRDKMVKKLQGVYVALACSKHGSRALDEVWEITSLKQKFVIMDELAAKEAILNSDQYGSILASKYFLSLYKHRRDEWKDVQGKENKKLKLFADIIGDAKKS